MCVALNGRIDSEKHTDLGDAIDLEDIGLEAETVVLEQQYLHMTDSFQDPLDLDLRPAPPRIGSDMRYACKHGKGFGACP